MDEEGWEIEEDSSGNICAIKKRITGNHMMQRGVVFDTYLNTLKTALELHEDLQDRYYQEKCGCGNPVCKSCLRDKQTLRILKKARGEDVKDENG